MPQNYMKAPIHKQPNLGVICKIVLFCTYNSKDNITANVALLVN